ncbi:MAG: hypothetical protein J7L88_01375, partial [Thermoplasmata archaeon]|nr:hypothetical protein [Thermoplasmata archaeon]
SMEREIRTPVDHEKETNWTFIGLIIVVLVVVGGVVLLFMRKRGGEETAEEEDLYSSGEALKPTENPPEIPEEARDLTYKPPENLT